jgi:hypothetical protein
MASEIRVNKIENRSGLGTVTFADTGVDLAGIVTATTFSGSGASLTNLPAANVTGTLPAISGANLTNLPAANLTGTLPAISGANLTGIAATDNVRTGILDVAGIATFRNDVLIGTAVTISESGIAAAGIGITVANVNGGQVGGRRNKLINGAMAVSERETSRTGTGGGSNYFLCDRWRIFSDNTSARFTISQASDTSGAPGLPYSFKFDCTTADTSLAASDYLGFQQKLEGQDVQDFLKGTSDAKEFTLSFYVKTNKSGVYTVELRDNNNSRTAAKTFTVSDGNWNRYILTFPADTTGALSNNNNDCLQVNWWLIAGSTYTSGTHNTSSWTSQTNANRVSSSNVNIGDSTDNNWEITGVQLEVGSQATAFEHRSFGEELALCQRYFYKHPIVDGIGPYLLQYHPSHRFVHDFFPVEMRTVPTPTVTYSSHSDTPTAYKVTRTHYKAYAGSLNYDTNTVVYMTAAQYSAEI